METERVGSELEGKRVLRFNLPHYSIPEGDYPVLVEEGLGLVRVKRIEKETTEDFTHLTGFSIQTSGEGSVEIRGDRYGLTSYCEITVFHDMDNVGTSKKTALQFYNRVARIYRCVSKKYWISSASQRDVLSISSGVVKNGEILLEGFEFLTQKGPQERFGTFEGKEVDEKVRKILSAAEEPPLYLEVLLNAREFAAKEDFRLCVVEGCIALEMFLHSLLKNGLRNKGCDEEVTRQLMGRKQVSDLLRSTFRVAFGKPFAEIDQKLWQKWSDSKNGTNKLRNDILHRGRSQVLESQGMIALETVEEIISRCQETADQE